MLTVLFVTYVMVGGLRIPASQYLHKDYIMGKIL